MKIFYKIVRPINIWWNNINLKFTFKNKYNISKKFFINILDNLSQDENNLILIMTKYTRDFIKKIFLKVPNLGLYRENRFYYKFPIKKNI